ncbi:Barstar (barnase inhibitor) [Rheinheimera pacifica]|uniref:Barstar (Barnase inhibitor) n=1 Tax=Rheinheimera pacifica TaxID=173990 RepID=A0A1H6JC26_9GAMM|nr:barstar family protein [Rheinheimera pacifica]SEH59381.1 Barstar (barnase inhibitor) [Rheinheimera pacifica]
MTQLDVSSISTSEELHSLLASVFKFPDYYGKNWDAFDECIRDFPPEEPIYIMGISQLSEQLPREADLLKSCLQEFANEQSVPFQVYVS